MKKSGVVIAIVVVLLVAVFALWKSGNFTVTGNIVKNYVPGCGNVGDADGNGFVDSYDANVTREYILGVRAFTNYQRSIMDLNNDGNITTSDVLYLNQYLLNKRVDFPLCYNDGMCIDTDYSNNLYLDNQGNYRSSLTGVAPSKFGRAYYLYMDPTSGESDACYVKSSDGTSEPIFTLVAGCAAGTNCYVGEYVCEKSPGLSFTSRPRKYIESYYGCQDGHSFGSTWCQESDGGHNLAQKGVGSDRKSVV